MTHARNSDPSVDRRRTAYRHQRGERLEVRKTVRRGQRKPSVPLAIFGALCLFGFCFGVGAGAAPQDSGKRNVVLVLPLSDAVGPVTAHFLSHGIKLAEREQAEAVVIQLDTPGGLDTSMRDIVKAILGASIPVIVWVAPQGARAASAGVFITLAAPIACMAPGTNIGAATPISIGGGPAAPDSSMNHKVISDAAAYARSLAELHGRNAEWAENAVRKAVSLTAEEAVKEKVVDFLAADLDELLDSVDGRIVRTVLGDAVLRTSDRQVRTLAMTWRERVLALVTNPSVAYLLFLAGLLGLGVELYHPGVILPGVVGAISLILAFFAFQNLPINAAGVLLILLGVVLFILEVKVPSYGVLSIGGVVSLVLGSLFLFQSGSALRVSLLVLVPSVLAFAGFFTLIVFLAARAQRRPRLGGSDGMVGEIGQAATGLEPEGKVFVHGEYWNARSTTPVPRGTEVRVLRVEGLKLEVEPAANGPDASGGKAQ
jgi:membrane-bound serine protease (ClpP class)